MYIYICIHYIYMVSKCISNLHPTPPLRHPEAPPMRWRLATLLLRLADVAELALGWSFDTDTVWNDWSSHPHEDEDVSWVLPWVLPW